VLFQLHSSPQWTPFFWEQDRVGMLWPLVTMPIVHPLANLLTQTAITTFCGLALPFVLLRLLDRTTSSLPALMVNVWLIAFAPDLILENVLIVCVYPSALFLGICGLLVLEDWDTSVRPWPRFVFAVGLLMLAHWVYIAVIVVLGPMAFGRLVQNRNRLVGDRMAILATVIGFGAGFWLMKYAKTRSPGVDVTPLSLNPLAEWLSHATQFIAFPAVKLGTRGGFWLFGAGFLGVSAWLLQSMIPRNAVSTDTNGQPAWSKALFTLTFVAAMELGTVSMLEWPCRMDHHPRYLIATWSIILLVSFTLLFSFVRDVQGPRSTAAVVVVLFLVAVIRFGLPSVPAVRADFDSRFGRRTEAFLASGAEAIGDEYWNLWPMVFHIELTRYERSLPPLRNVVGLRSCGFWSRWSTFGGKGFLVAVPKPVDPNVDPASTERGLAPFEYVREDEVFVYCRTRIVFRPFPGKPLP
jgi:hypothetical protein